MIDKVQSNGPAGYVNNIGQVDSKAETLNERHQNAGPSAEVNLSQSALALQKTVQAVKDTPVVRADIVQEIKGRIEAGTYKIDVEALAERLLPLLN